jgi:hypothetical protein
MSPARSKRTALPRRRSRAEIVQAVGISAGIVVCTAVLIWLLRPGSVGSIASGGLMNRQPRSSALVIGALALAGGVTWWVLRVSRRARGHEQVVLPVALGVVLVAAVIAGFAWPGGLLRHDVAPPPIPTPSSVATTSTTAASSTTTAAAGTSTTGATSTSAPATTGTATTTIP